MPTRPSDPQSDDSTVAAAQPAPAISCFVETDGLRLHYLDYGGEDRAGQTRPTLLCLHGSAANAHWFDFAATNLRADFRVLSMDQRGHGDSEWAADANYTYARYALDLAAVVEHIGVDNLVLVGHSMGGMVALVYASTVPRWVDKLVIVDTTMKLSAERISMLRGVGDRSGRSYDSQAAYVANYRLRPTGATQVPSVTRHMAEAGCREFDDGQWRNKFDRQVYASRVGIEGLPYWDKIQIPSLYIKGALSDRMTPQVAAEIQARCAHLQFSEVPAANHHVPLDNPIEFNIALRRFLNQ